MTTRYEPVIAGLADRLRRKELSRIVYFHTDHFEPWSHVGDAPAIGQETVDRVGEFVEACQRLEFARRLTLFYKPHLNYELRRDDTSIRADPTDLVGFLPRNEEDEICGKAAMGNLVARSQHEIQLHIHHEYYTSNSSHEDPVSVEWFSGPLGAVFDEGRLELAIRLNREIIQRETGRWLDRWFFVHGHWALNASDDTSCRITREIELLLKHGCLGDFTFPAGRPHVDPHLQHPYFCRPVNAAKGYDLPAAEPEVAYGNREAALKKFFIWASPAKSMHCSIDYFSESTRRRLDNIEKSATDLVDLSYRVDNRLFIKTHAHSVHPNYFEHVRTAVYPHEYPGTQALLSVIFEAADRAGVAVDFLTASEIYDLFVNAKTEVAEAVNAGNAKNGSLTATRPSVFAAASAWSPKEALRENGTGGQTENVPAGFAIPISSDIVAPTVPKFVRDAATEILKKRIAELGIRGSGAYNHYSEQLEFGLLVPRYEAAILDSVQLRFSPLTSCHEIGSGIATLSFMLALSGFSSVAIERDARRHETARAILHELGRDAPLVEKRCTLVNGIFPQAIADLDVSQSVAIVGDFISAQTPAQIEEIYAGLKRYRYVLIDLQRFCVRRFMPAEQLQLREELKRHGIGSCVAVIDLNVDGHYCLFENDTPPIEDVRRLKKGGGREGRHSHAFGADRLKRAVGRLFPASKLPKKKSDAASDRR